MNRRIKTLFLWLLLLTIPLQGFAAAMQSSCGPMHLSSLPSNTVPAFESHHSTADAYVHAQSQHHHGMAQHHADPDAGSTQIADAFGDAQVKHAGSCSACASCCIGAAVIPSTLRIAPDAGFVTRVAVMPLLSFTGFIPAGLKRPPRVTPS